LEFFVTAAFLVEDVRSVALAARSEVVFVAGGFVPVAAGAFAAFLLGACLGLGACFGAVAFFPPAACFVTVGPLEAFFVPFAFVLLALVVLAFLVLVFVLVFFAWPAFGAEVPARAVRAGSCVVSLAAEERLLVVEGNDFGAAVRAAARSVERAAACAPVAFLTAVFRADMCPP
jgi:hypothetical protein